MRTKSNYEDDFLYKQQLESIQNVVQQLEHKTRAVEPEPKQFWIARAGPKNF